VQVAKSGGIPGRTAFDQLILRHQGWLLRYLVYLLGDPGAADDVGQESFVRAFLGLRDLRDGRTFRAWLRQTATRLAFNHHRDRATRSRYEGQAATEATCEPRMEQRLAQRQAILWVLDQLPADYRAILVLFYVEELTLREIADVLDIGESAAKMRLSRARKAFRPLYASRRLEEPESVAA
jgi:RNA polymerase sigma-70 factor (ECF subfamily)